MDKIKCQHQDALKLPKDTKLGSLALKNNTNTQMFRCVFCDEFTPNTWICLDESCIFTGCDHTLKNHIALHIEETKLNNAPHYVFLNPITLKIFCFQCNLEVHDFELLGLDESSFTEVEGPLDPAKIRDIFASWFGYLKEGSIKYTQPQKNAKNYIDHNKGISGLVNIGNTSHFNAIFQILAHIPSIRYFYKALQRKVDMANFLPVGSTKKFSYLISELLANIWSGDWRILKPNVPKYPASLLNNFSKDAILAFFELNPALRGYGYKDIHDTFRCFLNAIHDEHRILVPKPFELGLQPVLNTAKKQDEWEIIDKLGTFLENSIVTDTFQGKMHSSFKCEKCKEELILEDYFTFLDLRIPKEKDPHRLKRWNIVVGPTLQKGSKEPTFHVYDALADFFETKFIRPSGNLYCERCLSKTPYQKYYRFLNMPNILCLHIKRQDLPREQNLKVQLCLDNFDVAPFVKKDTIYVQDETKYELIGYIENIGTDERPKYIPTLKNMKSGQWFTIRDHEFMKRDDKSILENYASMVFYRKKFDFARQKETRNLKSQIELLSNDDLKFDPSRLIYIPNYWFEKAISLASPGMIHTWHLLCKHGNIKPSYRDCFFTKNKNPNATNTSVLDASFIDKTFIASPEDMEDSKGTYTSLFIENQSVKLPKEIGEYFLEKYGGGPLIKGVNACQECLEEAIAVKTRRRRERKIISMYDSKKTQISYAVTSEWIEQWKSFLYVNNRFLRRNFLKGHPPPGPINNSKLFDEDGKTNFSLERNKHFRVVNAYVWRIFMELYGGGPEVKLSGKDLSSYLSPEHKVEIQMGPNDIEILSELRGLLVKDKKSNEKILMADL